MTTKLILFAFTGAVLSDLLAFAAALKSGHLDASKWGKPTTYLGMLLYGSIAGFIEWALIDQAKTSLVALSVGINLPLVLEKLAKLTPSLGAAPPPAGVAHGLAPARVNSAPLPVPERIRRFVAKI